MELKKEEVAVNITDKNREKVRGILEMFGEPYGSATFENAGKLEILYFDINATSWYIDVNSRYFSNGCALVKPKQLKQILAKEHLKAGDYFIGDCRGYTNWICKFKKLNNTGNSFEVDYLFNSECKIEQGLMSNFLRYATEEEKSLLEPKKELVAGKWYKHANGEYNNWLVFNGVNEIYGFTSSGEYSHFDFEDAKYYFTEYDFVEATEKEVETALIKEAKKRGFTPYFDFFYFDYKINILYNRYGLGMEVIFENGKWAEVIKQEEKPKKGDVCKLWDDDEDVFVVGVLGNIDDDSFPYHVGETYFKNAKVLTPEQVTELLFTK